MGAVERGQQAIAKFLHEGVEVHLRPEDLARLRHAGRRRQLSDVVHVRLLVHKKTADTPLPWRAGKARRGEWRRGGRQVFSGSWQGGGAGFGFGVIPAGGGLPDRVGGGRLL